MEPKNNGQFFVIFSSLTSIVIVLGVVYFSENHEQTNFRKYSGITNSQNLKASVVSTDSKLNRSKLNKHVTSNTRVPAQRKSFDPINARALKADLLARERSRQRTVDPDGLKYESLRPEQKMDFENTTGASYKRLKGFYAVKKTTENIEQYPHAEVKLGYLIIQSDEEIPDSKAVVENADSGALGIFTGVIKVKLRSLSDKRQILPHQDYHVAKVYDHISVVLYEFDSYDLTLESLEFFRSHSGVKRANIEVLEYVRKEK